MSESVEQAGQRMPSFVGMDVVRAKRIFKIMGIEGYGVRLVPRKHAERRVFGQSPEPGEPLPEDRGEIELQVEATNPDALLPEVFREWDLQDADFKGGKRPKGLLRRFLFLPKHLHGSLEEWALHFNGNFEADRAPTSFLPFLEGLFPYDVYSGWTPRQRRKVLLRMPDLLRKRGTAEGLELMIELYTDVKVKVYEMAWPYEGQVIGQVRIADEPVISQVPEPVDCFYVELPSRDLPRELVERIHRVVDAEKPAHLHYCLYAPPIQAVIERNETPLGTDFVVGESLISGDIVTPPARMGAGEAARTSGVVGGMVIGGG